MKSIGQILLAARKKKKYTIDDIHKFVKIHPRYIKAMEADDPSVFDGKVHSKGFLKVYAEFLDLDLDEVMALWRREYDSSFDNNDNRGFQKLKTVEPQKFVLTPTILLVSTVTVLLLSFFIYLFFQYKQFTDAPTLDIYHPQDNLVMQQSVLDITGKVELDSEVFINNQKIIANPDGSFLTSVKLREGINTISIKAINQLNKETESLRTIIYRPDRENSPLIEETISVDGSGDLDGVAPANEAPIEEVSVEESIE